MTATSLPAEPVWFGSQARPLFGWIHSPQSGTPRRSVGLVICNPFGYEGVCAHRSIRHFASAATATGIPAIRFDYDGTGDSAGDDRDPARWDAWLRSIHQAADELREMAGVERVCLLGIRLGAALAAVAAAQRSDVAGLIAIAPVLSGKAWLRELKALQNAMSPAGTDAVPESGIMESAGFVLTEETQASIRAVDLLSLATAPAREVLIVDRNDLTQRGNWGERLSAQGARVEARREAGYTDMMLDPHDAIPPADMIRAASDWLARRFAGSDSPAYNASLRVTDRMSVHPEPGIEETAAFLDDDRRLFGIVTAPVSGPPPTRAIVLLNAGSVLHTGPNRLYVQMARRWSAQGHVVLRFDMSGIGDSRIRPGAEENVVYSPSAQEDIAIALEYLRDQWGITQNIAVGLCSGAYHGLKAAVAGLPLSAVAIINPLVFFWKPGMSLAYPQHEVSAAASRYLQSARELEKWKKLFAGKVRLSYAARVALQRCSFRIGALARDVARRMGKPLPDDLGAELEAIARRGTALRFIFSKGDPGQDLLRVQSGSSLRRLQSRQQLRIQCLAGPDHTFTPVWTQPLLIAALEKELDFHQQSPCEITRAVSAADRLQLTKQGGYGSDQLRTSV